MFTRVVEINTKPGKAKEVCGTLHDKVLGILKSQPGFIDEVVLISDTEADTILAVSFWNTKEDAEKYARAHFKQVEDLIEHQVHHGAKIRNFNVETSTVHRIAKGKAA